MRRRLLPLITILVLLPVPAAADWLLSPFAGMRFGADTTFFDLDRGIEHRKFLWGMSAGFLTDRLFGLEADFSYIPGFFTGASGDNTTSRAVTLMGNVIVAAPVSATGYSLRPYVSGGLGWLHATARYPRPADALDIDSNLLGLNVGGGAIGPITQRSSIRFEIRHFRAITTDEGTPVTAPGTQVRFWRATVGLTFNIPS